MDSVMNILQATFVVLQSASSLDEDTLSNAQQVFSAIYSSYFNVNEEVKSVAKCFNS